MKKIRNVELCCRLSDIWCQLLSLAEPMPPAAYLLDYRLQNACRMLTSGENSITQIGNARGNKKYLPLTLEIADPGDYMRIVLFTIGDC